MARKKKAPHHENHERWLVSYADFITLMFAFFVVMFASSQADKAKAQQMSQSFRQAFGGESSSRKPGAQDVSGLPEDNSEAARMATLAASLRLLQARLKDEIGGGMLQVTMEARGIVISLRQAAFFPSGQDTIEVSTYPAIQKIAEVIISTTNKVRLEGHTDNVPIHTARFRSNWELSSSRSVSMLEILTTRFNVPESRLSVGGYAETIPIATNDTEEGRAQNRRVDVVILNDNGLKGEPGKAK